MVISQRRKEDVMSVPRVLLVDDDETVRCNLREQLELHDFEVVTASGVNDALRRIRAEPFDVLLSDLHMPGNGDGLTVVSAMRHANPQAVTMIYSGYPDLQAAVASILVQADEILVKPFSIPTLVETIRQKLVNRRASSARVKENVASILEGNRAKIIEEWLTCVQDNEELMQIPLSSQERTAHLPQLLTELVARLREQQSVDGRLVNSIGACEHGRRRRMQGYTAPLIVEESRMLQVSIFQNLQNNLARVNFSLVLVEVMMIADEVDAQLCQAMQTFAERAVAQAA
jgi:DNA-binding response OmpR family regulator